MSGERLAGPHAVGALAWYACEGCGTTGADRRVQRWLAAPLGLCCVTAHEGCLEAARVRRGGGEWTDRPMTPADRLTLEA